MLAGTITAVMDSSSTPALDAALDPRFSGMSFAEVCVLAMQQQAQIKHISAVNAKMAHEMAVLKRLNRDLALIGEKKIDLKPLADLDDVAAKWIAGEKLEHPQFHPQIQRALDHAVKPLTRYRCAACGFEAKQHFWQCPGCQTWDSYPARRVEEL